LCLEWLDSIFESILDEEPNHVGAILGKGKVLAEKGNFYEAIPYFVKARQIEPENEIARFNLEISQKQLVYAIVEGSIEIQLRDSNGFLVALFKTNEVFVLDHEVAKNLVNTWDVKKIISRGEQQFEKRQLEIEEIITRNTVRGRTGILFPQHHTMLIYGTHWGYPIEDGDHLTVLYTIVKPIE